MTDKNILSGLDALFGSYRAEWLRGKIFEFFAEPSYFAALQDNRPCVLEGGRGTGKTTVLRGLSYKGQYALHGNNVAGLDELGYIGLYHRVDTNHARALTGGGLTEERWRPVFGHYFNLVFCRELLSFLIWHREMAGGEDLSTQACDLVCSALHLPANCSDTASLHAEVERGLYSFQADINNLSSDKAFPPLSMFTDPIRALSEHALSLPQFRGKMFFLLLDEYENYTDYQQQMVNSAIKHCDDRYTFKVAVRELGWRVQFTLNEQEFLHDPADYVLVSIERQLTEGSQFSSFAREVCQQRIRQLFPDASKAARDEYDIASSLTDLSMEDEAELLGVETTDHWKRCSALSPDLAAQLAEHPKLVAFFLSYWASTHNKDFASLASDYVRSPDNWRARYENYKYEMLFKIRTGRGRSGIQKYYCGWRTYVLLASGNIRYLMELVYHAYRRHLEGSGDIQGPVSPRDQTLSSQSVAKRHLMELEGLWKHGAQLTRLLLGLGRVFQMLARDENAHAPEVNQFMVENSTDLSPEASELLSAAVMNLALVRSPGTKLDSPNHTRDYTYAIHPIYSPFFVFSHRKKRKMNLAEEQLLGLIRSPKATISIILQRSNVDETDAHLPTQLSLFSEYYDA